jgi:hypothetical protein
MFDTWEKNLRNLWNEKLPVHGLELWFDTLLLVLRIISLSYWVREGLERRNEIDRRNNLIDLYCCLQFLVLLALLSWSKHATANTIFCGYILFEVYLTLFNIVFLGKFEDINRKSPSIERVTLLMFLNVLHVMLSFAVLYRTWLGLSRFDALSQAVRVLGTVGAPDTAGKLAFIVDLQVLLDLLLLVFFLASFVGRVGISRDTKSDPTLSPKGRS